MANVRGRRFAMTLSDRRAAGVRGGSEEERARAFSTYPADCREYAIEGDVVVHRIAMSMFPNWVGVDQTRHFEPSGVSRQAAEVWK